MRAAERLGGDAICLVDERKTVAEMPYPLRVGAKSRRNSSRSLPAISEVL